MFKSTAFSFKATTNATAVLLTTLQTAIKSAIIGSIPKFSAANFIVAGKAPFELAAANGIGKNEIDFLAKFIGEIFPARVTIIIETKSAKITPNP